LGGKTTLPVDRAETAIRLLLNSVPSNVTVISPLHLLVYIIVDALNILSALRERDDPHRLQFVKVPSSMPPAPVV
jgi:hypothetical protein